MWGAYRSGEGGAATTLKKFVPEIVVERLPIDLRALRRYEEEGRSLTSANELGHSPGDPELSAHHASLPPGAGVR